MPVLSVSLGLVGSSAQPTRVGAEVVYLEITTSKKLTIKIE